MARLVDALGCKQHIGGLMNKYLMLFLTVTLTFMCRNHQRGKRADGRNCDGGVCGA